MCESGLTLLRNYVYHNKILNNNQIFTCDGNDICSVRIGKYVKKHQFVL